MWGGCLEDRAALVATRAAQPNDTGGRTAEQGTPRYAGLAGVEGGIEMLVATLVVIS
jgi:hypothetical protein